MRTVERYSLMKAEPENRGSMLVRDGKVLGIDVKGTVLETQFELESGLVLMWLTDDSPYDEGLYVYLVDGNDTILDALEAGADFTPGILKTGKLGKDWLEFEFFLNNRIYRLEVTKKAGIRLSLPAGWKYERLFGLHRLIVHEVREEKG